MARARSPDSIKAEKLYRSGMKLVEIAKNLGVPDGTVRRWKSTQHWDSRVEKKSERSEKKANVRKQGAPKGNKNAEGAGAPEKNKNAVKTGEFEALFFDTLESEEKQLIGSMPTDKEKLLIQEIQLLTVREHRMLKRIEEIKASAGCAEGGEAVHGMTLVKRQSGIEKGEETDLKEYQGKLGQIQAVEDALTRVQARKQKAIDSLHRFGFDDARLEIEIERLCLEKQKLNGDLTGNDLVDDWIEMNLGEDMTDDG